MRHASARLLVLRLDIAKDTNISDTGSMPLYVAGIEGIGHTYPPNQNVLDQRGDH